jgi:sugar transferase (PEP-CTERM system associated)
MSPLRLFGLYLHTPLLLVAICELGITAVAALLAQRWIGAPLNPLEGFVQAFAFGTVTLVTMIGMGVYQSRIREGYSAMMLRTAVAQFLIGLSVFLLFALIVEIPPATVSVFVYASAGSFALLGVWRVLYPIALREHGFRRRVLVLGTGHRAYKIASRMRRRSDQRGFELIGFLSRDSSAEADQISGLGVHVFSDSSTLLAFCKRESVDEIVVALDERRRSGESGTGIPLDELISCRLSGIAVSEVQEFIEREAGRIEVDLLRPSWLVFSPGFAMSTGHRVLKRGFDIVAALALLALFWPFMLLTALAVALESGFRGTILLRQERVGLNGAVFRQVKFRSMIENAEPDGPVWTRCNDERITRVGRFIRKSRLDELPQLLNVLRGDMSFVGPRPERPVFVRQFEDAIPFYSERHRIKPGITGWAQLCYPYGASMEDAREKLQYDLYYLKHHSVLMDLIILLQTVEVVVVGEGAR